MSEPLKAGRELDALIETQLFGRCAHQMAYVSTEELQSRARREIMAEWQANYGKQPPDAFVMAEAASRQWAQEEGDYSPKECVKCGVTAYGTAITPRYSTDIAAAWEVVEKLQPNLYLSLTVEQHEGRQYATAGFTGDRWVDPTQHFEAEAETAPLAICLAAVEAVRARPTEQETR